MHEDLPFFNRIDIGKYLINNPIRKMLNLVVDFKRCLPYLNNNETRN